MKHFSYSWITGIVAGVSALSAFCPNANAYWSGPTYTKSNVVPAITGNPTTTSTYPPQGGGSPSSANKPCGATISVKWTWVPNPNIPNDLPPTKVHVLQYGYASWNMAPGNPPAGMASQPSFQEISFSSRRQSGFKLVQTTGSGSANNGLGHAQVVTTDANGYTTGTAQGYKVIVCQPDANGVLTTPNVTLLASANPGPGPGPGGLQQYMPAWSYNAQLLNLAITCNGQDITNPKPAYAAYVGQNTALAFSFSGVSASDVTQPAWSLPTTYVKDWINSNLSASVVSVPATELASTNIPRVFWVSGGSKTISFTANIKGAPVSLTGTINVTRPTEGISVTPQGTITLTTGGLSYGVGSTTTTVGAGVVFNTPPNPNGLFKIAQVITGTSRQVKNGTDGFHNWVPSTGLDAFPGPRADSPSDFLLSTDQDININESFDTWLMYRPTTTGVEHQDWIYVPLKKFSWSWSAHAKRRGANWVATTTVDPTNQNSDLISAVPANAATGVDSFIHPTWTQKASPPIDENSTDPQLSAGGKYVPSR